ncbi:hypothetical protein ACEN8K_34650, partial [Variovorax sp. CT11-76]
MRGIERAPRLYVSQRGDVAVRAAAALRKDATQSGGKVVVQAAEPMRARFAAWDRMPRLSTLTLMPELRAKVVLM